MSYQLACTRPLDAVVRVFKSEEHLNLWIGQKKVDVFKSNIPGVKILRFRTSVYGDIIVLPVIASDWDAVDKKTKSEANKK